MSMMNCSIHGRDEGVLRSCKHCPDGFVWYPPKINIDCEGCDACVFCGLDADGTKRYLMCVEDGRQVCSDHLEFAREFGFGGMAPLSLIENSGYSVHKPALCSQCGTGEAESRLFMVSGTVLCLGHAMDDS